MEVRNMRWFLEDEKIGRGMTMLWFSEVAVKADMMMMMMVVVVCLFFG